MLSCENGSHPRKRTACRTQTITITSAIIIVYIFGFATSTSAQEQIWQRDKLVGLSAGTCIREGPSFNYRAHTRVPENNWTVMIIDGPRMADGRTWWDTSRKAAGDPSGGTGWVTEDQSDTNCDSTAPIQPTEPIIATPTSVPFTLPPIPNTNQDLFEQLKGWWYQQTAPVKWGIAVVVLLLISTLWRIVGGIIIELIGAVLFAIFIWIILNLTRAVWQETWEAVASPLFGGDIPDLALLLAVLPLVSWGISFILRSTRVRV